MSRREVPTQTPVGGRLRLVRKRLHWSQDEMARRFGVTQGFITMVERGASGPSAKVLAGVEREGYSGNWLLTGEAEMLLPAMCERVAEPMAILYGEDGAKEEIEEIRREMAKLGERLERLTKMMEKKRR